MKQRITVEELMELTDSQKHTLQGLWTPQKYDQVLANICIDVENELYRQIEFILGDVRVFGTTLYLWDYRVKIDNENDNDSDSDGNNNDNNNEAMHENNDNNENDYSLESASATESDESDTLTGNDNSDFFYYNKDDCLPLLSVGQMMEILHKNNYGELYFYTTVGLGEEDSGVGRDGNQRDYESPELCDALWECIQTLL